MYKQKYWYYYQTTLQYEDAVYCYQTSSVVCHSVGWSLTLVSPAKMAELIEMPFGLMTCVGPGNHVLDRGPDPPPKEKGQF